MCDSGILVQFYPVHRFSFVFYHENICKQQLLFRRQNILSSCQNDPSRLYQNTCLFISLLTIDDEGTVTKVRIKAHVHQPNRC